MIEELKRFINSIDGFNEMKSSVKVDILSYYLAKFCDEEYIVPSQIQDAFEGIRQLPYSNIPQYLRQNSNKNKNRRKKIKFISHKKGFQLEASFEKELEEILPSLNEDKFIQFRIDENKLDWKPSDIPLVTSKIKKNAHFFTKLYYLFYHLENSIRKFLIKRLSSIIGSNWESEIIANVDLTKAQSIRKEVNLSKMLPNRGESILYYCMWDDYAKIMVEYPNIFSNQKEANEIIAHLGTLTKIRNAIAHNTSTIPSEYQDELTVFLNKYMKLIKDK